VYWRKAGVAMPLQVVVIRRRATVCRNRSKLLYRQPAYLIARTGNWICKLWCSLRIPVGD